MLTATHLWIIENLVENDMLLDISSPFKLTHHFFDGTELMFDFVYLIDLFRYIK